MKFPVFLVACSSGWYKLLTVLTANGPRNWIFSAALQREEDVILVLNFVAEQILVEK